MSQLTLHIIARNNNKPTEFEIRRAGNLLPCPFCNNQGVYFDDEIEEIIRLICNLCGACGAYRDCRINAIRVWNQRGSD